uniref:Uncharacterized protein n=1 Tax=Oryza glumipatula TaxID=40148 RepID=A0A0E0AYJ9_9ORYZ
MARERHEAAGDLALLGVLQRPREGLVVLVPRGVQLSRVTGGVCVCVCVGHLLVLIQRLPVAVPVPILVLKIAPLPFLVKLVAPTIGGRVVAAVVRAEHHVRPLLRRQKKNTDKPNPPDRGEAARSRGGGVRLLPAPGGRGRGRGRPPPG